MVQLVGGEEKVISRAHELAEAGDFRLARELIELATSAEPESVTAHGARAEIYMARRHAERSLMAKGIYAAASRESTAIIETPAPRCAGAAGSRTGTTNRGSPPPRHRSAARTIPCRTVAAGRPGHLSVEAESAIRSQFPILLPEIR